MDYYLELVEILKLFETYDKLGKALMIPLIEMEKRKEILSDVLKSAGSSLPLSNMLRMILEKNRMNYLPLIKEQYGELINEKEGKVKGTIWTPYPVSDDVKAKIEEVLKVKLKKEVDLQAIEDKSLIGGLKVQIKGTIIDGSVKKQLETLRENILKE